MLLPLIPNLTADAAATPAPPAQGQSPSPRSTAQLPPDTMLAYFCPSGLESVRSQLCWAGRALLLILTCSSNMKAYKSTLEICLQNRIFFYYYILYWSYMMCSLESWLLGDFYYMSNYGFMIKGSCTKRLLNCCFKKMYGVFIACFKSLTRIIWWTTMSPFRLVPWESNLQSSR